MKWRDIDSQTCSIARSAAILGDRWTLLILRDCMFGIKRFDTFEERLGLPRATLTKRLKNLVDAGVMETRTPPEGNRKTYHLTAMGRDLIPVINMITNWGDKHLSTADGPPMIRRHKSCGHDIQPVLACPECGEALSPGDLEMRPGPGFDPQTFKQSKKRQRSTL